MSVSKELFDLAKKWYERGEISDSRILFTAAQETAATMGDDLTHAEASYQLARIAWFQSHPKLAEHLFEQAHDRFAEVGHPKRAFAARLGQAFMAYDATDHDKATELLDELGGVRDLPMEYKGQIAGYRGNIARHRNRVEDAIRYYDEAIHLSQEHNPRFAPVFKMDKAVLFLLDGDLNKALGLLEQASDGEDNHPISFVGHYTALAKVQLGESIDPSQLSPVDEDSGDAVLFLSNARSFAANKLVAPFDKAQAEDTLSALKLDCPPTEHARLTVRILSNIVGVSPDRSSRLVLNSKERSARFNGNRVVFAEHSAEWAILWRLGAAHAQPAHVVTPAELIQVGWPEQQLLPKSAKNRLHVALSNLRAKGLREILLRHHNGYALSRAVQVVQHGS